jgi:hypothetical protein
MREDWSMERDFEGWDEVHGGGGRGWWVKVLDSPLALMIISEIGESDGGVLFVTIDWPATLVVLWFVEAIVSPASNSSSARDANGFGRVISLQQEEDLMREEGRDRERGR